jgi:hypothetical protein
MKIRFYLFLADYFAHSCPSFKTTQNVVFCKFPNKLRNPFIKSQYISHFEFNPSQITGRRMSGSKLFQPFLQNLTGNCGLRRGKIKRAGSHAFPFLLVRPNTGLLIFIFTHPKKHVENTTCSRIGLFCPSRRNNFSSK